MMQINAGIKVSPVATRLITSMSLDTGQSMAGMTSKRAMAAPRTVIPANAGIQSIRLSPKATLI